MARPSDASLEGPGPPERPPVWSRVFGRRRHAAAAITPTQQAHEDAHVETIKTTDEHIIVKKRSGRYGVKLKKDKGAWVNGDDKVKVLLAAGLLKQAEPKAKDAGGEAEGDA